MKKSIQKKINSLTKSDAFLKTLFGFAGLLAPEKTAAFIALKFLTPRKFKRPQWEKELLEKGVMTKLSSGRMFWTWGEGPSVLLVHGWEGRGTQLGAFITPLIKEGYRVLAWDGPAHGESPGTQTHLSDFAKALSLDLAEMGEINTLIAHSMGGPASLLALEHTQKVRKLILLAAPSQWMEAIHMVSKKLGLNSRSKKALIKKLEDHVGEAIDNFDVLKRKPQRTVPMLIMHAPNDRDVPFSEMDRLHKAFPHAQTITVEGLGHRRILKDSTVIKNIIQFIKEGT